jgi:hypothetical protein
MQSNLGRMRVPCDKHLIDRNRVLPRAAPQVISTSNSSFSAFASLFPSVRSVSPVTCWTHLCPSRVSTICPLLSPIAISQPHNLTTRHDAAVTPASRPGILPVSFHPVSCRWVLGSIFLISIVSVLVVADQTRIILPLLNLVRNSHPPISRLSRISRDSGSPTSMHSG